MGLFLWNGRIHPKASFLRRVDRSSCPRFFTVNIKEDAGFCKRLTIVLLRTALVGAGQGGKH